MKSLLAITIVFTVLCFQAAFAQNNQYMNESYKISEQCYDTCLKNMCSKFKDRQYTYCYFELVYNKNCILDNCHNLTYEGCLASKKCTYTNAQSDCIQCWQKCRKEKTQKP